MVLIGPDSALEEVDSQRSLSPSDQPSDHSQLLANL